MKGIQLYTFLLMMLLFSLTSPAVQARRVLPQSLVPVDHINVQLSGLHLTENRQASVESHGGTVTFPAEVLRSGDWSPELQVSELNQTLRGVGLDSLFMFSGCSITPSQRYYVFTICVKENHSTHVRDIELRSAGVSDYVVYISQGAGSCPALPGGGGDPDPEEQPQPEPDTDREPVPEQDSELLSNWIKSTTYTSSTGGYEDITYYNGLGYAKQVILIGAGVNSGKNVVTPVQYDHLLRGDSRTYLPYVSPNAGAVAEISPVSAQAAWYASQYGAEESVAYSKTVYESSSDRVLKRYHAGRVFQQADKYASTSYHVNLGNEVLNLSVSGTELVISGSYGRGMLSKIRNVSEDGSERYEYTDKSGRTVLDRLLLSGGGSADTYYVYNEAGELAVVIQPEGSAALGVLPRVSLTSPLALNYFYVYRYDGRGNLIEKRQPGRSAEFFVYDQGGRLVLYQDGALRSSNRWIYRVYDNHHREVESSVVSGSLGVEQLRSRYLSGTFDNRYPFLGGTDNVHVPFSTGEFRVVCVLSSERYYGSSYPGGLAGVVPFESNSASGTGDLELAGNVGLRSGERLLLLDGSNSRYITRSYYYDRQGRLIQQGELFPEGIHRSSYRYDYCGNVVEELESCGGNTKRTQSTYDVRGRLLSTSTSLNGGSAGTVTYSYNDLGQLVGKIYGNGVREQLSYNLQGWQTVQRVTRNGNSLYSQELRYYSPEKGSVALYGGAVSEWSTSLNGRERHTYGFTYDLQGRLTGSDHYRGNSVLGDVEYTEGGITYDRNGNLQTLKRYAGSLSDDLTYKYTGNRLTALSGTQSGSYVYDSNGNMTGDSRKNLQIRYNFLNLAENITRNGTLVARYIYLSDGTKYSVDDGTGNGYVYIGSLIYSKSPFHLSGTATLESCVFPGGLFKQGLRGSSYEPSYYTSDHLGSVRLVTDSSGNVEEENGYYPFGKWHNFGQLSILSENRFKYNGKEEQTTGNLGYLDYGARMYDTELGRWFVPDPLGEWAFGWSSYRFSFNDPVNYVDADGLFETRQEAREYRKTHDDVKGRIERSEDGTYVINDRKGGLSYSRPLNPDWGMSLNSSGVQCSPLVTPQTRNRNPLVRSIYEGQDAFLGHPVTQMMAGAGILVSMGAIEGLMALSSNAMRLGIIYLGRFSIDKTANIFGKEITKKSTRIGRDGKAVEIIFRNGSKIDINKVRVKEWAPNKHPGAPAGTLQKIKFDNSISGSKGYKRLPTQEELQYLNNL